MMPGMASDMMACMASGTVHGSCAAGKSSARNAVLTHVAVLLSGRPAAVSRSHLLARAGPRFDANHVFRQSSQEASNRPDCSRIAPLSGSHEAAARDAAFWPMASLAQLELVPAAGRRAPPPARWASCSPAAWFPGNTKQGTWLTLGRRPKPVSTNSEGELLVASLKKLPKLAEIGIGRKNFRAPVRREALAHCGGLGFRSPPEGAWQLRFPTCVESRSSGGARLARPVSATAFKKNKK